MTAVNILWYISSHTRGNLLDQVKKSRVISNQFDESEFVNKHMISSINVKFISMV